MKSFLLSMLAVLTLSVAAADEPTIQKGEPPTVEAKSFVPPGAVGILIVDDCRAPIAVQYLLMTKDGLGIVTRSPGLSKEDWAPALEEATFILKAGGPVRQVELSPDCKIA